MSFTDVFSRLQIKEAADRSLECNAGDVQTALGKEQPGLADLPALLSPAADAFLEVMCAKSVEVTRRRFGRVIRLFAPLYLSNECVNNCQYCGFSRDNPILRVTLSVDEVLRETRALKSQGFRNILLVSGEHPRFVTDGYLQECVRAVASEVPGVSIEVGPMEEQDYVPLVAAGAEGLVVYQETYDREVYASMHTAGPKRDFDWRLATPERGYRAGFRRLGIGALFGLTDWRAEAIAVAAHAEELLRNAWKAQLTISLPRLRPCAGEFQPPHALPDRCLVQLVSAFRLIFPDVGLVLSTREPAWLRDGLIPLGITSISAGSHTEPGGYTGAGREKLHRTERGRIVEAVRTETATDWQATGQFDIADARSPGEMAEYLRRVGLDPVWKDWEGALGLSLPAS